MADELRKLAELRDEGILTTEEFESQKAALLGSAQPSSQCLNGHPISYGQRFCGECGAGPMS
ncbi:MAG: SHOCT domain-containing protein [Acidimicrobiia bacterium]|nr:SHOCT domain-containing protein [Acidimicrobiia bacterium]